MMRSELDKLIEMLFQSAAGETANTASSEDAMAAIDYLSIAAEANDIEFFQKLVQAEKQQTRNKNQPTLLIAATMERKVDVVQALVQVGADIDARVEEFFITFDALEFAVDKGYTEIVEILLKAGANPNSNTENPGLCAITTAVRRGNPEIVEMLLEAGAIVKFGTGFRLLVDAAQKSTAEIVQLLIDAGCNVNTREVGQDTPLTAACKRANVEMVRILIEAGANVNKTGMHDFSPLIATLYAVKANQMFAQHGFVEADSDLPLKIKAIVQMLVNAGADLSLRDLQGRTPLMLAVLESFLDVAQLLIAAGAEVDTLSQPDDKVLFLFRGDGVSRTALHFAVESNQEEAVKLLLKAGASVSIPDGQGNTPLNIAESKVFTNIVQLLC